MPKPPSAASILRNSKKQKRSFERKTPIATDMYLPNHSGDHSRGKVNTDPTTDQQIANKKYVDEQDAAADAHAAGNGSDHSDVADNTTSIGNNSTAISTNTTNITTNATAIALNTTHRGDASGADHSDLKTHADGNGLDHAAVAVNKIHTDGDGSDHADVATNTAKWDKTGSVLSPVTDGNEVHVKNASAEATELKKVDTNALTTRKDNVTSVAGATTLTDNIQAYYKLDESGGVTADDATENSDGTFNSAPTWEGGKINNGATTSGSERCDTGIDPDETASFSVSFWLKTTTTARNRICGTANDADGKGWALSVESDGYLGLLVGDGTFIINEVNVTTSDDLNNGAWRHVVLTYNSATDDWLCYVDGDYEVTLNGDLADCGRNLFFSGTPAQYFTGSLDEFGYWNKVLDSTEVTSLYNSGSGLTYPFGEAGTAKEINVWQSRDGISANEFGAVEFGDDNVRGTINGKTIRFNIDGTEKGQISGDGNFGMGTTSPTQPISSNEKVCMTAIGGVAIKLTNTTGASTVQGQTVKADTATDDAVILTAADDDECLGVFLESGIADDAEAWVVVGGIADVLMGDNEAATHGNWVETNSAEAGYADATAGTPAAAPQHFNEIGHCIETVAAGGAGTHILARCVLHFN